MAQKHMKRSSTSSVIWEMFYNRTPIHIQCMMKIKGLPIPSVVGKAVEKTDSSTLL